MAFVPSSVAGGPSFALEGEFDQGSWVQQGCSLRQGDLAGRGALKTLTPTPAQNHAEILGGEAISSETIP
jgi:hypothetical protein